MHGIDSLKSDMHNSCVAELRKDLKSIKSAAYGLHAFLIYEANSRIATVAVVPERYEALQDWLEVQDDADILNDELNLSIGDNSLSCSDQSSIAGDQVVLGSDDSLENDMEPILLNGKQSFNPRFRIDQVRKFYCFIGWAVNM